MAELLITFYSTLIKVNLLIYIIRSNIDLPLPPTWLWDIVDEFVY